jgi:hypothetical protein
VDFILRYRGDLPAGKPTLVEKHRIRRSFHPQLKELCVRERAFEEAAKEKLTQATFERGRMRITAPTNDIFLAVPFHGVEYVPLIHRGLLLACALDIVWLRHEKPGDIVQGGDIDNRLKGLFDGLRMPQDPKECCIDPTATSDELEKRCYCLLEDDSLITKLAITTHQLLEPKPAGRMDGLFEVELLLHVTVVVTYPVISNSGFST